MTDADDTHAPESGTEPPDDQTPPGRYAVLSIDDGDTVIYDRENPRAWISSDDGTSLGDSR